MSQCSSTVEQWLPVVGFEGYYEVSDLGRVRSVDRIVVFRDGRSRIARGRIRRFATAASGHKTVSLCIDNKLVTRLVHRLVLESFVGPCPLGSECLHANDHPDDNRLSNLRWGTRTENMHDMVRNGKHAGSKKTRCPLGGKLGIPNATACSLRKGSRDCLACNKAQTKASYCRKIGRDYDLKSLHSKYYAEIMADIPKERW